MKYVTSKYVMLLKFAIVPLPGESSRPKSVSQTPVSRPVKGPGYVDIPLTGMRLTIAKRLTESKVNIQFGLIYLV